MIRVWLMTIVVASSLSYSLSYSANVESSCSDDLTIVDCWLLNSTFEATTNNAREWSLRPFDLRLSYIVRTNFSNGELYTVAQLKWYLIVEEPEMDDTFSWSDLTGFKVKIVPQEQTHPVTVIILKATVNEARIGEAENVQYFVQLEGALKFGQQYTVEISLLPLGDYGGESMSISIASSVVFALDSIAARDRWSSEIIQLEVDPVLRAVNVSFVAAPFSFPFESYDLRLVSTYQQPQMVTLNLKDLARLNSHHLIGSHVFSNLIVGARYEVQISPRARLKNGSCACTQCMCMLEISQPFQIPPATPTAVAAQRPARNSHDESLNHRRIMCLLMSRDANNEEIRSLCDIHRK